MSAASKDIEAVGCIQEVFHDRQPLYDDGYWMIFNTVLMASWRNATARSITSLP